MHTYSVGDYNQAFIDRDFDKITEASMSRIYNHIKGNSVESYAIMSPDREVRPANSRFSGKSRKAIQQTFQNELRSRKLGYIPMTGHFAECPETDEDGDTIPPEKCPVALKWVQEMAFFIPKISLQEAKALANRYDQDSIVYSGPEMPDRETAYLVPRKGGTMALGPFRPNNPGIMMSVLKGARPFKFGSEKADKDIEVGKFKGTESVDLTDSVDIPGYLYVSPYNGFNRQSLTGLLNTYEEDFRDPRVMKLTPKQDPSRPHFMLDENGKLKKGSSFEEAAREQARLEAGESSEYID